MIVKNATARINLQMTEGESFAPNFRWKVDGVYKDLTGYTGRMQVRERITDTETIFDLTTANGGVTISSTTTGMFGINIEVADSVGVCADHRDIVGTYDFFLDDDDIKLVKIYGTFTIKAARTR